MDKLVQAVRLHWKKFLLFLGVPTLLDIFKEYFRGKLIDWMIAHFGSFGGWVFLNPWSLLTSATVLATLYLGVGVLAHSGGSDSLILDSRQRKIRRPIASAAWRIGFGFVVTLIIVAMVYGMHEYLDEIKKPQVAVAIAEPIAPKASVQPVIAPPRAKPKTKVSGVPKQESLKDAGNRVNDENFQFSVERTYPFSFDIPRDSPGGLPAGLIRTPPTYRITINIKTLSSEVRFLRVTFDPPLPGSAIIHMEQTVMLFAGGPSLKPEGNHLDFMVPDLFPFSPIMLSVQTDGEVKVVGVRGLETR